MTLTSLGEVLVETEGGQGLKLRPSLAALSSIGTPAEIVEIATAALEGDLLAGLAVIYACCDDRDLAADIFGYIGLDDTGLTVYKKGISPVSHIGIIASTMVLHGMIGKTEKKSSEGGKYSKEFDALEYASMAVAHLGLSEADAWNMTMTGLHGAMMSKFGESKRDTYPDKDELEATMEWFDQITEARVNG